MVIVVMGVAGSGKSMIGSSVAGRLRWEFADADDLHPAASVEKMKRGEPLNDDDRWPWLEKVAEVIDAWISTGKNGVVACSSLKESYRDKLRKNHPNHVRFAYLKGSYELFEKRLRQRKDHFMKSNMLESQMATLEEPMSADAFAFNADQPVDALVEEICSKFRSEDRN
ncbi:MAG TPA: gluconokinase [Oculatellaceae cyanobacterium]